MMDMYTLSYSFIIGTLLIGIVFGIIFFLMIQGIFVFKLQSKLNKHSQNFEEILLKSQIKALEKLLDIQKEHVEMYGQISLRVRGIELYIDSIEKNMKEIDKTLFEFNDDFKKNSYVKKELENEIVKLKNIISRTQKNKS